MREFFITETRTLVLSILLTCISTIAVILRLFRRQRIDKRQRFVSAVVLGSHLDDIFCFIALLAVIPTTVVIAWGAARGAVGSHSDPADAAGWMTSVTPKWVTLAQVVWIVLFLQPIAIGMIKLSVLFFYRRLFLGKIFNVMSWILIAFTICWMAAFFIGLFFDCGSHISANWGSLTEISEQCKFGFLPTIVYTVIDAVLDLTILIFPLPWVFATQMSLHKKLSVTACLMLGGFATAAAFIRMTIFIQSGLPSAAINKQYVVGYPVYDVVGIVGAEMFWTMIESTVALTAICLPTFKKTVSLTQITRKLGLSRYLGLHGTAHGKSKDNTLVATDIELGRKPSQCSTAFLKGDNELYICTTGIEAGSKEDFGGLDSEIHKAQEVTVVVCSPATSRGSA